MLKSFFKEMAVHSVCLREGRGSDLGVGHFAPKEVVLSNTTRRILQNHPHFLIV